MTEADEYGPGGVRESGPDNSFAAHAEWHEDEGPMNADKAVTIWREIVVGMKIPAGIAFDGERYEVHVPWQIWEPDFYIMPNHLEDLKQLARRFHEPYWNHSGIRGFLIGTSRKRP